MDLTWDSKFVSVTLGFARFVNQQISAMFLSYVLSFSFVDCTMTISGLSSEVKTLQISRLYSLRVFCYQTRIQVLSIL